MQTTQGSQQPKLIAEAAISGAINAVINGVINWYTLDKTIPVFLTQDSISSHEYTVFSGAVPLAVSLAFILTSITYFTSKIPNKPSYFPGIFLVALKHSVYAFGLVAIAGMLIQRYIGSVEVSHIGAAIWAGLLAGLAAGIVNYETQKRLLEKL